MTLTDQTSATVNEAFQTTVEVTKVPDQFVEALASIFPENPDERQTAQEAATKLKALLEAGTDDRGFDAVVKASSDLRRLTGLETRKLVRYVVRAAKSLASPSWACRNFRAVALVIDFNELRDIRDRERLTILGRVPADLQAGVFKEGRIEGLDIRHSDRKALRQAVNELRKERRASRPKPFLKVVTQLRTKIEKLVQALPDDQRLDDVRDGLQGAANAIGGVIISLGSQQR